MRKQRYLMGLVVLFAALLLAGRTVAVKAADDVQKPSLISSLAPAQKELGQAHIRQITSGGIDPTIEWDEVEGALAYRVYRKMPGDEKYVKVIDTYDLSFTDRGWEGEAGTKIVYKVRAFALADDHTRIWGKYSVAKKWISKITKTSSPVSAVAYQGEGLIDQNLREGWEGYYCENYWYDSHFFNIAYSYDGTGMAIECCDYDGNSLYGERFRCDRSYFFWLCEDTTSDISLYISTIDEKQENFLIKVYGLSGSLLTETVLPISQIPGYPGADKPEARGRYILSCYEIYGKYFKLSCTSIDTEEVIYVTYLSLSDKKFHDEGTFLLPALTSNGSAVNTELTDYDKTRWGSLRTTDVEGIYFATNVDETRFYYLNKDFEILAAFPDATEFTRSGYALITDDRMVYYIMNKDLEIVGEYYYSGISACLAQLHSNTIAVYRPNEATYCIKITE